jgi:hypothetical protein
MVLLQTCILSQNLRVLGYFLPRNHLKKKDVEVIDLVVTSELASKRRNL